MTMLTVLLLAALRVAHAVPDLRPVQTAFTLGNYGMGFSPAPTRLPAILPRFVRRDVPDATCGYISDSPDDPIVCDSGEYCASNSLYGVFGCCTTYTALSDGQYTLRGCTFQSACLDFEEIASCTGSCANNTLIGSCPNSIRPYCRTYSLTDLGISAFVCSNAPGSVVEAGRNPITTAGATTSASTDQSNNVGVAVVTVTQTDSGGAIATQSSTPSSSKSSVVGPAVGGAVGGLAVILLAIGGGFWLRMKRNKNKAALSAGGAGAAGAGGNFASNGGQDGSGVPAMGAYASNTHYNNNNSYTGEQKPPMYSDQQVTQVPPNTNGYHSPNLSEMPSSPQGHNSYLGVNQHQNSLVEAADSSVSASTPLMSGVHQMQRESIGTGSLVSGSNGERTELDNTSTSGRQPTQISSVSNQQQSFQSPPSSVTPSQTQTQPQTPNTSRTSGTGLGYQAGPAGDWNRPFHELE